jgi:hypothetical protein
VNWKINGALDKIVFGLAIATGQLRISLKIVQEFVAERRALGYARGYSTGEMVQMLTR